MKENFLIGDKMRKKEEKIAFISMCVDYLHYGHINVILHAKKYGKVVVGLLTDEAIETYKRKPFCTYEQRKIVLESVKWVDKVIKQDECDFVKTIRKLKPDYVVNGDDWKTGVQSPVRDRCIETLKEWGGELIEIPYTKWISSSKIIEEIHGEGNNKNI